MDTGLSGCGVINGASQSCSIALRTASVTALVEGEEFASLTPNGSPECGMAAPSRRGSCFVNVGCWALSDVSLKCNDLSLSGQSRLSRLVYPGEFMSSRSTRFVIPQQCVPRLWAGINRGSCSHPDSSTQDQSRPAARAEIAKIAAAKLLCFGFYPDQLRFIDEIPKKQSSLCVMLPLCLCLLFVCMASVVKNRRY
jgi:hypothetical protein